MDVDSFCLLFFFCPFSFLSKIQLLCKTPTFITIYCMSLLAMCNIHCSKTMKALTNLEIYNTKA